MGEIEFQKECEYCGNYAWCSILMGWWHCGCEWGEE